MEERTHVDMNRDGYIGHPPPMAHPGNHLFFFTLVYYIATCLSNRYGW